MPKAWAVVAVIFFSSVTLVLQPWRSESDSETSVYVRESETRESGGAPRAESSSGEGDSLDDQTAVPEPTTTILMGLSAVLLAFVRRR